MKARLEKVPSDSKQSFYFGHYKKNVFDAPWHYHPHWELTLITKGEGVSFIGNAIRHFSEGELVLIGGNLPHCWRSEADQGDGVESFFIQWDSSLLGSGWLEKPEFSEIKRLLFRAQHGLLFDRESSDDICEAIKKLNDKNSFLNLAAFLDILHRLCDIDSEKITVANEYIIDESVSTRVENIIRYVDENYQSKITSKELSDLTHMTPTSFSKSFRKAFNKTFTSYLNELRVSKACSLIRASESPLEDIAYNCGYNNMAFFHRQFRRQMGLTPLQYRKLSQEI